MTNRTDRRAAWTFMVAGEIEEILGCTFPEARGLAELHADIGARELQGGPIAAATAIVEHLSGGAA